MAVSGAALAYSAAGGLVLYSGIKGATIADTVKSVLAGNLAVSNTEAVDFSGGSASSPGAAPGDTGASTTTASQAQAIAKNVIAVNPAYAGWNTGQQWADLVSLWNQESGWNHLAKNASSGAYGIAQALPASKYPAAAQAPPVGTSDAAAQITWGLAYIKGTYGSPVMAWAHEQANNWY